MADVHRARKGQDGAVSDVQPCHRWTLHMDEQVPRSTRMCESGQGRPRYLSSDHDPLFAYHRWQANLRVLDVEEVKTVPYVPLSHPFVKRLIGTIQREFLDQILYRNSVALESKLLEFRDYDNREHVHTGIGGSTPCEAGGALTAEVVKLDNFRWEGRCRGLYQLPVAA